jgi:hypothetical protein
LKDGLGWYFKILANDLTGSLFFHNIFGRTNYIIKKQDNYSNVCMIWKYIDFLRLNVVNWLGMVKGEFVGRCHLMKIGSFIC